MLIDIDKIKIPERARKTFSNIDKLAASIKEIGLIHPPTVTPEFELIAGERRLRALKQLGYSQIEVRVMSVKDGIHHLKMERDENDNRENFTFSEAVALGLKIEEEERKKAKERQGNRNDIVDGRPPSSKGKTRDAVAEAIGLNSGRQYDRAKYIYDNADPELIKQLDEKQISIHAAYQKLKKEKEDALQQVEQLKEEKNKITNESITKLNKQIEERQKDYDLLLKEKMALENKMKLVEEKNEEYENLKQNIEILTKKREDISRQIESTISISGLVVEVDHLIKDKLAPIKWSRAIQEMHEDEIVIENLTEIINTVQSWCDEMREYLPNQRKIINVEAM